MVIDKNYIYTNFILTLDKKYTYVSPKIQNNNKLMYKWNRNTELASTDFNFEFNKKHYNVDKSTIIITQFGNCGSKGSVTVKRDSTTQTIELGEKKSKIIKTTETIIQSDKNDQESVLVATKPSEPVGKSNDFYAYKICLCGTKNTIVKLFVGKTAKVAKSFNEIKMRTEEALVVNMWKIVGNDFIEVNEDLDENVVSLHDITFRYAKNAIVRPTNAFNSNLSAVCESGIHFFLKPENALKYKGLSIVDKNFTTILDYKLVEDLDI